jgi:hypothetical protein
VKEVFSTIRFGRQWRDSVPAMNNKITSTLTGLASSLLLNTGLTQIAEKLDPVTRPATQAKSADARSTELSVYPCNFTKDAGQ